MTTDTRRQPGDGNSLRAHDVTHAKLKGDICHGGNVNGYYHDPHHATGHFGFVVDYAPSACHAER